MRGQFMFYNKKNITGIATFALFLLTSSSLWAQGVVTLSEDAMFDDEETSPIVPVEQDRATLTEETDELSNLANEVPAEPEAPQLAAPVIPTASPNNYVGEKGLLGADDVEIDDEVFFRMSDLEKQTALLNLELRREKVKNEIEAIKNQRKQAVVQEKEKAEEKRRKQIEWEKNQEQKVLQEQQELRELDIQFEKVRQEKLLNAYKNDMLSAHQDWIEHEESLYKQIDDLREQKQGILDDTKNKLSSIKANIAAVSARVPEMVKRFEKELENKQTQITLLKSRIEAQERELEKRNPFAEAGNVDNVVTETSTVESVDTPATQPLKLANMYAVMEIRGQNGELIAKLINQEGMPFYVKKGTMLQSGHEINEITSTYVKAEKEGLNDYLYFAAGGILPHEQPASQITPAIKDQQPVAEAPKDDFATSIGVPGLGKSMIAR